MNSTGNSMRWVRRAAVTLGSSAVLVAAVGVAAHYLETSATLLVVLASAAPLLMMCGLAGLVTLAVARWWAGTAVAAVVLAAAAWTQLPLYTADRVDAAPSALTVLQANIFFGNADLEGIVAQVRSRDVDMLTVNELTDAAVSRLGAAGLDEELPFRYLRPTAELAGGTGIWSRYPLSEQTEHLGFALNMVSARVQPPGQRSFVAVAAHPLPPVPRTQTDTWSRELGQLQQILRGLRTGGDPVVVGGDFNATFDHSQYRALTGDGFRDAAEQSGAGMLRTYPADRWWPPVLAIDHVLVAGADVTGAEAVDLPGSDHRGVLAAVVLAPAGDQSDSD